MNDHVGSSTQGRRRSTELWNRASYVTSNSVAFSRGFHTLRDMVQNVFIDATDIHPVKNLGEGAFASVKLCTVHGRLVAVKYLKPSLLVSDKDVNDFLNEAALLKKLSHSAIVGFIGIAIETEPTKKPAVTSSLSETALLTSSSHSRSRRLLEAVKSRLTMKSPKHAVGQEINNEDTMKKLMSIKSDTGVMSMSLKNVMLIQEYMTRGTLKSMLLKQMEHPMRLIYTRREALDWLIQIAQGLRYLHQARPKIIHRDLKLENIMLRLDSDNKVKAKIGDFGVHAVLKEPKHSYESDASEADDIIRLSLSTSREDRAAIVKASYRLSGRTGSLMYMAPEVLHCQPYNEKADVFSFAMIMYELFCKTLLLCFVSCSGEQDEVENYAQRIACGGRPLIPEDWPQELQSCIRLCWRQDPNERPSMSDLIQHLQGYNPKNHPLECAVG